MKEIMHRLYHGLIVAVFVIAGLYIVNQHRELHNKQAIIMQKQYELDSVKSELFVESINVTRYEIALEYLKEESPSCYDKYNEIISTKTE